jgi:hypothetical protein
VTDPRGTVDLTLHAWDEPAETLLSLAQPARARALTPLLGRPFEPAHAAAHAHPLDPPARR